MIMIKISSPFGRPFQVILLLIVFATSFFFYSITNAAETDRVDKILKTSGISDQIEDLINALFFTVPDDAFPSLKSRSQAGAILRRQGSGAHLLIPLRNVISNRLGGSALEDVERFYDSKIGKKVARLNGASLESNRLQNLRESRKTLVLLDEPRIALLKKIIEADQLTKASPNFIQAVARGMLEGSATNKTQDSPELNEKLQDVMKSLTIGEFKIRDNALLAYAFTYQSLTDSELEEFSRFQESESGKMFIEATVSGLEILLYDAAKMIGNVSAKTVEADNQTRRKGEPE